MPQRPSIPHGLTLLEMALSLLLIAVLLSILLPALSSARAGSFRDRCQANQRQIGQGWFLYLQEHDQKFPTVPIQPGWYYGGMRFSAVNDAGFPDFDRPLTRYCQQHRTNNSDEVVWCCPSDRGITASLSGIGTGRRTAFRSYGTSYRANSALLWFQPNNDDDDAPGDLAGAEAEPRGMYRSEITTASSRLVLMGDPVWYEVAESTGLHADWHGEPNAGNLLFLDGAVRFMTVQPREVVGPILFDPVMHRSVLPGTLPAQSPGEIASEGK